MVPESLLNKLLESLPKLIKILENACREDEKQFGKWKINLINILDLCLRISNKETNPTWQTEFYKILE